MEGSLRMKNAAFSNTNNSYLQVIYNMSGPLVRAFTRVRLPWSLLAGS